MYGVSGGFVLCGGCDNNNIVRRGFIYKYHGAIRMYRMSKRNNKYRRRCNQPAIMWYNLL